MKINKTIKVLSAFILTVAAVSLFSVGAIKAEEKIAETSNTPKKELRFLLLRPDDNHPFWVLFQSAMASACKDLGCTLDVKLANWDSFKMVEDAAALKNSPQKPDVVFFQSFKENGEQIIKALQEAQVDGFLINAGLTPEQSTNMGKPREKYSHWIGQMLPDDSGAGAAGAEALYKEAKSKGYVKDGKIQIAAIEGISTDGASIERLKGLHSVMEKHPDIDLLQVVQGKWDKAISEKVSMGLLKRYPDLHVIWSAGDPIAMGVISGSAKTPGSNVITAGVDWAPEALDAIENGTLVGSAGGHFMEGAWAAVLAYDYKNGIDFSKAYGLELKSSMGFLNKNNIAQYKAKFGKGDFDAIDYKTLSQFYGAKPGSHKFDISEFLK